MAIVLSLSEIKKKFNQEIIKDIEIHEVSKSQSKLCFVDQQQFVVESEIFDDQQLAAVVDFILASKSSLALGC